MQIFGTGNIQGPQAINQPHQNFNSKPAQQPAAPSSPSEIDQLDISPQADMVSRAREIPDVRTDLVNRLRSEIQSGTYETDAKLDVAMNRLLDEIG